MASRTKSAKAARRSIRDPALAARTLADPIAGPLLRELQSSTLRRLSERLPGPLNDIDQFSSISPISAARIGIPMLVIHGNADRVVPFAHGQRVGASAPNAELVAIDGGEHVSLFTHLDPIRQRYARSSLKRRRRTMRSGSADARWAHGPLGGQVDWRQPGPDAMAQITGFHCAGTTR